MTDEEPLTPIQGEHPRNSLAQSSAMRDSVITYSTDVPDSSTSMAESRTNTFSSKPKSEGSEPFYRRKRFWAIYITVNLILLAIFIPLFIFAIFPAIAQSAINGSTLNVNHLSLTNIREDSVTISSEGKVINAGPFSSTIFFDDPISMIYKDQEMAQVNFDTISTSGGNADIILSPRDLRITNKDVFGNFSLNSFIQDSIKMRFKGSARVKAIGITKSNLLLDKEVTLIGASNFPNVSVKSLEITEDSQGIAITHVVELNNTSIFDVDMGRYGVIVSYNGSDIANMTIEHFNLQPGVQNISMSGYAIRPNNFQDASSLGAVMTAYLTNNPIVTQAKGIFVYPNNDNISVSWLTSVITQLTLNAVVGNSSSNATQVIKGLDLGQPNVNFVGLSAYAPLFSTQNTIASYQLPFKINTTILQVSQNITLFTQDGQAFAYHNTSIINVTEDNGAAILINIPPTPLFSISDTLYGQFFANLTQADQAVVNIEGSANILANTSLGIIPMYGMPFKVSPTLTGFSNFSKVAPIINNVTVLGGTQDSLILGINASLYDSSNTSISVGNTTFLITYEDVQIGLAGGNLSLVPGFSNVSLQSSMDPKNSVQANQLLTNYLNNVNSTVTVSGYNASTDIDSLKLAFASLSMNATLTPLTSKLITGATIHILDTTPKNGLAQGNVNMTNPFVAGFNIQSIQANITAGDLPLATVSQSNLKIDAPGLQSITTNLPISLNLDPKVLFTLLRQQAKLKNLPTDVIDVLINIGEIKVPGVPSIDVTKIDPDIFKNFDIIQFTKSAMSDINTTMTILADVLIGQYDFTLNMTQSGVISQTDDSIVILIQYLSIPIVSKVVNASNVVFSSVQIQKPSETGFTTVINGEINGGVPIPAQISTPNGVTVSSSDGAPLGTVNLPTITMVDGVAELKDVTSQFTISDKDALSAFTQEDLHADKISWSLTSSNITVTTLGLDIPDIPFDKKVQLDGAGGFKDAVKINGFKLPGDDPNGGISTEISSKLTNKGTIGIELGTLFLDVIANNIKIGEVFAKDVVLKPKGDIDLNLSGRLIPQQSEEGLQVIQAMFNAFLAGEAIPLSTKGTGIDPSIDWLVAAIQSLTIDTVLPPQKIPPLITAVSLDELELAFTPETAYDPVTSSKNITANIQMPFGFSLNVSQIAQETVIIYDKEMAKLVIPLNQALSDIKNGTGTVTVSYQNIPLQVNDDSHDTFNSFVKDLTIQDLIKFGLQGSTEAHVFTPVGGPLNLSSLPVDVKSTLPGFQGFTAKNTPITSIDVTNGTNETLFMEITTSLFNPTNTETDVGDVNFDFFFEGQNLGFASIKSLNVAQGNNNISSLVSFQPSTPDAMIAGIKMFSNFIEGKTQTTVISGSDNSTEVDSLKEAFSALNISKDLPGLSKPLISSTYVVLTNDTLKTGFGAGGFTMDNPFTANIAITGVVNGSITFHDITLGTINVPDSPIPITFPGKQSTKSLPVPVQLNLNPDDLINIIKLAAKDSGIDCQLPFPGGNSTHKRDVPPSSTKAPLPSSTAAPPPPPKPSCDNITDVLLYVLNQMKVDISIVESRTKMDQFGPIPLPLVLKQVSIKFDNSILLLMNVVGKKVAQAIIDQSKITMKTSFVTGASNSSFMTHTEGAIENAGNLKSNITYPSGLTLTYNNQTLGTLTMPPTVNPGGNSTTVPVISDSAFNITDVGSFVKFSAEILLKPQITFSISADDILVNSQDIGSIPNLTINKEITIDGLNGLQDVKIIGKGEVTNHSIELLSSINNPSNVGAVMGNVTFDVNSTYGHIGPLVANNLVLHPKVANNVTYILYPTIPDGYNALVKLIAFENGTITINGDSVQPNILWLSIPIKGYSLTLPFTGLPPDVKRALGTSLMLNSQIDNQTKSQVSSKLNIQV
ncbi:hypothetical protein F8M41_003280 [Gigaspora margarita]|uniref:Uncharacterized protein n=2 Tax=Gigaspora margarita TaxID=4874 RepID=A0A8H4A7S8_GIGMA|nr:hypothetical protein F8M41_003280 [Gigaspora margarita]